MKLRNIVIILTHAILTHLSWNNDVKGQTTIDLSKYQEQAMKWIQEYIKINTINPPGNEIAGAEFFGKIFKEKDINYEIIESSPGRGNIVARLDGGNEPAILLLHHMDVVPVDEKYWDSDPLSGEMTNGYIFGRGAIDNKSSGIMHLSAFLALHQSGVQLNRKVIFMGTADEEAGSKFGVGWLVENRPDLFNNVGFVLTEGGGGTVTQNGVSFGVEITQKIPYWFRLTTTGPSGHASGPPLSYATVDLIDALKRLRSFSFPNRVIPEVDQYFKAIAGQSPEPWKTRFLDLNAWIRDPGILREFQEYNPRLYALTCNTCAITRISGSTKVNVISTEAWAEVDCRLLPDENPEEFNEQLKSLLGENIEIQELMVNNPGISIIDTELYSIIEDVSIEFFPKSNINPFVQESFTDSHFFRNMGIISYGFVPVVLTSEDLTGIHGNNERISEENIRNGVT